MISKDKIIALYCIVNDLLKATGHLEDKRRKVSDSEIITTAIVSTLYFGGHHDNVRRMMQMARMVPDMVYKKQFLQKIACTLNSLLCNLFFQLGQHFKDISGALDMCWIFPGAVCDNIRISRSRL